jgi:uncharacterized protein (TIGR02996 family)
MIDHEAGFLKAIRDKPADPTSRLVYADWLEESGESAPRRMAEWLRLDVALTGMRPVSREDYARWNTLPRPGRLRTFWLSRRTCERCRGGGEPPKKTWGDGPWRQEPDADDWSHAGVLCAVHRNSVGAWCAYVVVPKGHKWHRRRGEEIDCPQEITWSNATACCLQRKTNWTGLWFIGWDYAHGMQLCPAMRARGRRVMPTIPPELVDRERYYTLEQVRKDAEGMAELAAKVWEEG